ncbi:hypothetical protein EGW08_003894 [Elysia chlorotica]|uniref:Uncharacterized protein n=1 Tax=Elysia chlorotica TaxID=188477 RepID=A0A3S1BTH4_ELYCH|nr:hypothetical protein EGW08_003894 [Elysia chlorotica]
MPGPCRHAGDFLADKLPGNFERDAWYRDQVLVKSLQESSDTEKMLEPKLLSDVEWEELEEKQPTKLSAAERVLNKTSASRNSLKTKKAAPTKEGDTLEKKDNGGSRDSTGKLDLSKMDKMKIKELGFPVRLLYDDFISRYKIIVFSAASDIESTAEHCRFIAKRADLKEYEITDSKILLSYADVARLNKLRRDEEKKIILAQAQVRGYLARSRSGKLRPPEPAPWEDTAPESRNSSDWSWMGADQSPCSTLSTRTGGSAVEVNSYTSTPTPTPRTKALDAEKYNAGKVFDVNNRSSKIFNEHLKDTLQKLEAKPDIKV